MSSPSLQGRIALVTGASRGIGRAAALALADEGAHVIAVARTVGGLEELDDAIQAKGGTATLVPLDLKDSAGIDRMGAAIFERWGKLDMLPRERRHPRPADAAHASRAEGVGRDHGDQSDGQFPPHPLARPVAAFVGRGAGPCS